MKKDLVLADHELGKQLMGISKSALNGSELVQEQGQLLLRRGREFKQGIKRLISRLTIPSFSTPEEARAIMGENFFGVEEAVKHFGVQPTEPEITFFSEIPWSPEVLVARRNTHILVAVFALSIDDIHAKAKNLFFTSRLGWGYGGHYFRKEKGEVSWELVRKTPMRKSVGRSLGSVWETMSKNLEVPSLRILVYAKIGHFLSSGKWLFLRSGVLSHNNILDSDAPGQYWGGARIYLLAGKGINMTHQHDGQYMPGIGVAGVLKK